MNPAVLGRATMRDFSTAKVVVDGNSIYTNYGSVPTLASLLAMNAPLAGTTATTLDRAGSGRSWQGMVSGAAGIDVQFDPTKVNILVCGETTNTVGGSDAATIISVATSYIAARRAANAGWKIVLCSGLPRDGYAGTRNTRMLEADALMRANWKAMGADIFVDFRQPGSPFAHDGTSAAVFQAQQSLWQETTDWLHLTTAGKTIMAQYVSNQIKRLKRK